LKIAEARTAFLQDDPELSKIIHEVATAKEKHKSASGEYVKAIVFGGLDGIVTTFAVVAAAAAGNLTRALILIIGFANLLGDAIGMAVGDYLSSKAEKDFEIAERRREQWEMDNCMEEEKQEMREIYEKRGLTKEQASEVVDLLLENPNTFLEVMMIEELGMMPSDDGGSMLKGALVTFGSFLVFGGLPMLAYLCAGGYSSQGNLDSVFFAAIGLFVAALFVLGSVKGAISSTIWWKSGLTMLLNGSITTVAAYFIGWGLEQSL